MKGLGISSVLCLMIMYVVEVCEAECDEYIVALEEFSCSKMYMIKPMKRSDINWDKVEYPCNSTEEKPGKKICLVEFNCFGTELHCQDHIKVVNKQSHYFIADNRTTKPNTIITEAPDITNSKIIVKEQPNLMMDEEFNASMYDINLIFINDNDIRNKSETITKTPRSETICCYHVEAVCVGEIDPENYDFNQSTNDLIDINGTCTHHKETNRTLKISIDRDENSPVQPIFTGYFPESSKSVNSSNYSGQFKYLKTMSTECPIPKHRNCKQKPEINVYLKVNYIENNTITKYLNCTKGSNSSENVVNVKCEDISFVKHNRHIVQTHPTLSTLQTLPTPTIPLTPPTKQETWNCQLKLSENHKIHFINCSKETNFGNNATKFGDNYMTPYSDREDITIPNISTKNVTEMKKTETGEETINNDASKTHPENMMTILVTENTNDCSQDTSICISEGKIIDLRVNNKEKILQKNNVELIVSNCINNNSSTINNKEPPSKAELTILLKNESLSASNLEQFNGTAEDKSVKQRILLRCNHPNNESSNKATVNKTTLQCESINLDYYNITGIEIIKKLSETPNTKINKEQKKENLNVVEKVGSHNNSKLNNDKTVHNNGTDNNNVYEEHTNVPLDNKEVQKNISEAKEDKKSNKNKEVQNLEVTFNRRKDIPNSARPISSSLGSAERENVFLIALLTLVGVAILIAIVWRVWPKKREYNAAPTREPQDEEETAF